MAFVLYLIVGILAGVCSGLLGIGGGGIVVPALAFLFMHHVAVIPDELIMHMAIGTSLAIMIVTTGASARAHHRHDLVHWSMWRRWVFGLMSGIVIGVLTAKHLSFEWLSGILATFLSLVALKMLFRLHWREGGHLPNKPMATMVGMFIGFLSGLLGVGGGVLMVPFLNRSGLSMVAAAGTATASTLPIAIFGALSYIVVGWAETLHVPHSWGYVYLPAFAAITPMTYLSAPLGAKLARKLSSYWLKKVFAIFLLVIAAKLWIGG